MLDIRWIRDNPDALDQALEKRGSEPAAKQLIALDEQRRAAVQALQDMQTRRNAASKEIGQAKAEKDEERAQALMTEVAALKNTIKKAEEEEEALTIQLGRILERMPNLPLYDVPVGKDESANVEIRRWGEPSRLNFAREHFELGEALGLMDFETAAKLSGSRFVVLKGQLARLDRALGQFMLDLHTAEHGYTEVQPPYLVRDQALQGTGQLPKFATDLFFAISSLVPDEKRDLLERARVARQQRNTASRDLLKAVRDMTEFVGKELLSANDENAAYVRKTLSALVTLIQEYESDTSEYLSEEDEWIRALVSRLWLIPTAEVPLTNLVRDSILPEEQLPLRFTALTPCFRSEAGSAGKDTRGMLRQHQFDKVELVSITTPEQSHEEHERMTLCAEEVLKQLDLAYRVVTLSTGDMGFAAQKTYDIEVWLPGQKAYREISSCSVCGDFQARRMDARYRKEGGKAPWPFVHTLNGSGVAVGRALIAVMETYQNDDGSIAVPDVLRPYMGGMERVGG